MWDWTEGTFQGNWDSFNLPRNINSSLNLPMHLGQGNLLAFKEHTHCEYVILCSYAAVPGLSYAANQDRRLAETRWRWKGNFHTTSSSSSFQWLNNRLGHTNYNNKSSPHICPLFEFRSPPSPRRAIFSSRGEVGVSTFAGFLLFLRILRCKGIFISKCQQKANTNIFDNNFVEMKSLQDNFNNSVFTTDGEFLVSWTNVNAPDGKNNRKF